MRTVYKYPLPAPGTDALYNMGASTHKAVHVGPDPQHHMSIWFELDTDEVLAAVRVFIVGTGHPIPRDAKHAGSFVYDMFVWHVYYETVS